jgi:hypothetical protein
MTFAGASLNEIVLFLFLTVLVVVAPKVPKIGEKIGSLFDRSGGKTGESGENSDGE